MDTFTQAFFEAALWSSNDNSNDAGGDPLDDNYTVADIAPVTLKLLVAECERFQSEMAEVFEQCPEAIGEYSRDEMAGHDFWLTRCGHGCGFWDGDWPELQGVALTERSQAYGNVDLYVGDDGKIYAMGYEQEPN